MSQFTIRKSERSSYTVTEDGGKETILSGLSFVTDDGLVRLFRNSNKTSWQIAHTKFSGGSIPLKDEELPLKVEADRDSITFHFPK